MKLYHVGFDKIEIPDLTRGRKNADFGQGFYLSDNEDFSRRWARERRGCITWLNKYELDLDGLRAKRFERSEEWFGYIFGNRAGQPDPLRHIDVIAGPVANDTIYDTWGLLTSGLLSKDQALQVLSVGPQYTQVVIKTARAARQLKFLGAEEISRAAIEASRAAVQEEEEYFQAELARVAGSLMGLME